MVRLAGSANHRRHHYERELTYLALKPSSRSNTRLDDFHFAFRGPRIIATDRQAPRICPRMIPLCSRFDSVLFTPKMFRIASYGDYSRSPLVRFANIREDDLNLRAAVGHKHTQALVQL